MSFLKRLPVLRTFMGGSALETLQSVDVPISTADCRYCANPCDEGHEEFPARFGIDTTSTLIGSVKPYRRQVLISTGVADWAHDVTDVKGSLASHIHHANGTLDSSIKLPKDFNKGQLSDGIFSATSGSTTRLSVLNGSHKTYSEDHNLQTVLVLPDYKVITDVEATPEGASALWRSHLDPRLTRAGAGSEVDKTTKTFVLPYNCVILLCSHKKRDNRCHIAAPKLETTFSHYLQMEGWQVDTQLEDLSETGPPLEDFQGSTSELDEEIIRRLKSISSSSHQKRALILKNSHIGGHKFAGNVIIYYPQGAGVWYGRVTPHEVCAIVKTTILEGKILPTLLRGGSDIQRPNGESLLDW